MSDPRTNWEKIETEEQVVIPTLDGQNIAEVITVKVPAYRDPATGEIYLSEEGIRKLDDVKARHLGLMTTEEIKRLRARLGATQKQLSGLLQIGDKTWTRWESGRERPSRSMNLLLRALHEGRIDVPWLLKQQGQPGVSQRGSLCIKAMVYNRPDEEPTFGADFIALYASGALLPGFDARIMEMVNRSIWMVVAEQEERQAGPMTSQGPANFLRPFNYHSIGSATPWSDEVLEQCSIRGTSVKCPHVPSTEAQA